MVSTFFRCPHCRTSQKKSDHDLILSQAAGFAVFGPDVVICRACGREVDRDALINGDYDDRAGPVLAVVGVVTMVVLAPALMHVFDLSFWVSAIVALIIGGSIIEAGGPNKT